ncbi:tail terminator [Rhodococcus phage GuyFagieri]|nr:tail terminator [Rhodococcus phage GuyFagieri]
MSEWHEAPYPDFEKVVGVLLRPLVAYDEHIGNFLVAGYDQIAATMEDGTPFITILKRGGPIDPDDFTAYPLIEVSCWGKSRPVAVKAEADVLRLMMSAAATEVDGALIDSVEDLTGSEEVNLENPDDRCVTRMFRLGFRPQYPD